MAFTMRFGGGDRRGGGGGRNGDTTKQAEKKPNEIQLVVWYTEAIPLSIGLILIVGYRVQFWKWIVTMEVM